MVLTIAMREFRHWPSIAGMLPQAIVVMTRMGALDCLHDITIYRLRVVKSEDLKLPVNNIVKMAEFVLKNNIFEFNGNVKK